MTSTSVKDVGSVLNTLGAAAGTGTKPAGSGGFHTVFNGQAGRNTAEGRPDGTRTKIRKVPGDSLKAKDDHMARVSEKKPAKDAVNTSENESEPNDEKLEQIMEVLGTAAVDMMQQIADTFGVSMEELHSAMEELGMDGLDVLDREQLGALLLKLGGAQDSYALVTNGELYGNYQELMAKLEDLLEQAGEQLHLDPEQLGEAMRQIQGQEIPEESVKEAIPMEAVETVEDMEQTAHETENSESGELVQQSAVQTQETPEAPRENTEQHSGSRDRHSENREHPHLFGQTVRTDGFQNQFRPELQQTQSASESWSTDTRDIMRQIMDYMRVQVKADTSSLEMQLHPERLGTLHIQVASKGGVLTANFITQNEAVKAALESQMVQLRENFEQQGVKVEAIEVTVQSHAFERNLDQGRGQSGEQSQPDRRTRTRRINLDDSLDMENLEEEDALAAEMMAASGSQVDYTV